MPFSQVLVLEVPTVLLGAGFIIIFTAMAVYGLITVRRFISHQRLRIHHDVAGPLLGVIGMAYTVLIAFIFVTVWQGFDKSSINVEKEANYLVDLFRDAEAFTPDFRKEVRNICVEYGKAVVTEEWETMAMGESSPRAQETLKRMWTLYCNYSPRTETEKIFFAESVGKLNEIGELRRTRVIDSRTGIPPILWFVLLVGGAVTIVFTFFFGAESLNAQVLMTALLSALIALMLFTILLFDFPFTGDFKITPKPFYPIGKL